jgi:ferredoxin
MATKDLRLDANVPGPWYIDSSCLPCLRCLDEAGPDTENPLLLLSDDESYVFFGKQPQTESELAAAESALEVCPQNAIGKGGSD